MRPRSREQVDPRFEVNYLGKSASIYSSLSCAQTVPAPCFSASLFISVHACRMSSRAEAHSAFRPRLVLLPAIGLNFSRRDNAAERDRVRVEGSCSTLNEPQQLQRHRDAIRDHVDRCSRRGLGVSRVRNAGSRA